MAVFVLCYHAANINGRDYADNDHIALAEDLRLVARIACPVLPLSAALALATHDPTATAVALTADDGIALDFEDFTHPQHGEQPAFARILREAESLFSGALHLSSFVIASPDARQEIDQAAFLGLDLWHQRWWGPALESGRMAIESHSFDHNHPSLARSVQRDNRRGNFHCIDNEADCEAEIAAASHHIAATTGRAPSYFAYPWGQGSDYLRRDYLPRRGGALGLRAAFSTEPGALAPGQDRWWLPRLVCGDHWRDPAELEAFLRGIRLP
jgi:hypothetical protein